MSVDLGGLFQPQHTLEVMLRGALMYLVLYLLLRVVLRRELGETGATDILVVVLLADAAQNGMAGRYTSITDGVALVVAILGPVQAALYAAATRFLVVGQLSNQAISVALQPRLSAALARRDLDEAGMLYRTTTGWLVLTTWPLYLLVGAFPAALLGIFGHKYASATDVVYATSSGPSGSASRAVSAATTAPSRVADTVTAS